MDKESMLANAVIVMSSLTLIAGEMDAQCNWLIRNLRFKIYGCESVSQRRHSGRKMNNVRKIQPVVRKVTFAEAEKADDIYWANATEEERFNELANLRLMVFGNEKIKVERFVLKRSLHEKTD